MKIKTILLVSIICLCISNLFAQEKITIIEKRTTTTEKNWETLETKSRTNSTYYFRLGDNKEVISAGKKGKDLRKYLKDEEALRLFDKATRQLRWGNATFIGMLGGMTYGIIGGRIDVEKEYDDQGNVTNRDISVSPGTIIGGSVLLGSVIARVVLHRQFDKNFAKSIELHNNTVPSGSSRQNMRIENIGFTLDNRTSRPQLYLSWRF